MFGAAWSEVSSAGGGAVGSGGYSLLHSTVVDCDLVGSHPVDLPLVVEIGALDVHLIVLSVSALHHVVVVDGGDVFGAAAQAFGREDFLFGSNDVDAFFWFVDFAFKHFEEAGAGCIDRGLQSTSILILLRMIYRFSIFMLTELNWASAWPTFILRSKILLRSSPLVSSLIFLFVAF